MIKILKRANQILALLEKLILKFVRITILTQILSRVEWFITAFHITFNHSLINYATR